jgi:hypothetical protein
LLGPSIATGAPFSYARKPVATTSRTVRIGPRGGATAVSKNSVAVGPGHSAKTRTPRACTSSCSASENDRTNALLAPYTDIQGTG